MLENRFKLKTKRKNVSQKKRSTNKKKQLLNGRFDWSYLHHKQQRVEHNKHHNKIFEWR